MFRSWYKDEIFSVSVAARGFLYGPVPKWCSGRECRRELNVPSPPVWGVLILSNGR